MRSILLLFLSVAIWANLNTPFTLYRLSGEQPGPTLLVFGGIHGNEPGGFLAPAILARHYRILRGHLWIVPNLNPDSIVRCQRGFYGDMNRKFSTIAPNDPDRITIERIKRLILNPKVDLILNLHDGHGYYRKRWINAIFNPKAWGQACIIDQRCIQSDKPFGDLNRLAQAVAKRLNRHLTQDHHFFNVKNTHTKEKDKQMRLSLTYFAIRHGKPAMAIETSKNITDNAQKTLYQLRAIEGFMDTMGIIYKRDFDLNLDRVDRLIRSYGHVVINHRIALDLDGIDPLIRNLPLKKSGNRITEKDHPLAMLYRNGPYIDLKIGCQTITRILPEAIKMGPKPTSLPITIDGHRSWVQVPGRFTFERSFIVHAPPFYRINVIGFSQKGRYNENGLKVTYNQLRPTYATDRANRCFRIEIYKGKQFCGMVIAQYKPIEKKRQ